MTNDEIESRALRAQELFKQGFNCAQAVFTSCADIYGITDEQLALRLSASFGGGMGRMRLVCGAASGMFMLAGLQNGSATPHDSEGKMANYAFVRAELLGLAPKDSALPFREGEGVGFSPKPADRTPQYYEKRPCSEMIAEAVRMYLRSIN